MKAMLHRRAMRIGGAVLSSLLLLLPCFWQSRIQAGDLSSHVYNAWLAQLIERGQAPGLTLVRQSNNVLFDLMLSSFMRVLGAGAAQRLAVSLAVLVFFWGSFLFVWSWSRRNIAPWQLAPCFAILAYGWVFHMGFFNFYISLGLSFGALALLRKSWRQANRLAIPVAVALFVVAYVAHALPVVWGLGLLAYYSVAQALPARRRVPLVFAAICGLTLLGVLLGQFFPTRRGIDQVVSMTGADQVWLYGQSYVAVAWAVAVIWALCLARVVSARGLVRTLLDVRFQLCAICAASLVLLPGGVLLPGYRSALDFIAERMSLAGAILFCALVASVRLPKPLVASLACMAAVFFFLSYSDELALNKVETEMARVVAQLPPGQRVISVLADPESRIKSMQHVVDRVCVGHCFSYANYEPTTAQFRVRADRENPFVVSNYKDSWTMQTGGYVVKPKDLPLYTVDLCEPSSPRLCVAPLQAGTMLRNTGLRVAPILGGG
jgi:hypothetical protein